MVRELSELKKEELEDILNQTKILYRDNLGLDKNDTFGMEVEFVEGLLDNVWNEVQTISPDWKVGIDPTVCDDLMHGGEVRSPILYDAKSSWEVIDYILEDMNYFDCKINDYCAGHVHIGAQIMGEDLSNYADLVRFWAMYEDVIIKFAQGDYHKVRPLASFYSAPIRDKIIACNKRLCRFDYESPNSFIDDILIFKEIIKDAKYSSISFRNVYAPSEEEGNTIELRAANGSLNPVVWQNNINFYMNLLKKFSDEYDKEKLRYKFDKDSNNKINYERYDLEKASRLADFVFAKEIDKFYFLKQYTLQFPKKKLSR